MQQKAKHFGLGGVTELKSYYAIQSDQHPQTISFKWIICISKHGQALQECHKMSGTQDKSEEKHYHFN